MHNTGNEIGNEGAHALAQSLKQNATLMVLDLGGMLGLHENLIIAMRRDIAHDMRICSCTANKIGAMGAYVLAESLRQNTTLTELNLPGVLELHKYCL